MALIMSRWRPPGFSPLSAAPRHAWLALEFAFVGLFARRGSPSTAVLGETHQLDADSLNPLAIAKTYSGLSADRFLIPARCHPDHRRAVRDVFGCATRADRGAAFHADPAGLFFAGTVIIVFAAGMLATKLAPRFGLDRSIQGGLLLAAAGSIAILLVSIFAPDSCPSLRNVGVPARHGYSQSLGAQALAIRRL